MIRNARPDDRCKVVERVYETKSHGRRYDGSQRGRALEVLEQTQNVDRAAKAAGATTRTVRRWAREAGLPPVRKGGRVKNLDRRSFLQLLGGQAAMLAAAPASAAELISRDVRCEPTGVVRAYFVPASIYSHMVTGALDHWRPASEEAIIRELLEKGPIAEPQRVMDEVRTGFEKGEIGVRWGEFHPPPAAGLLVINDTLDEVQIGASLWSTGHAQFFCDGAPIELDLLTLDKARDLGLQLRRTPR